MHDIAMIRQEPEAFDAGLARRGADPVAAKLLDLDSRRRAVLTELQEAQNRRNAASKAIGQAMGKGDTEEADRLKAEVTELKATTLPRLEEQARTIGGELDELLAGIPNLPADDVPDGAGEDENVELSSWGEKRAFDFQPREHADIGPYLGLDFEIGADIAGARFTFLRGQIARLHRALGQFMLDRQTTQNEYLECNPPLLVRDEALFGTGQLPKFAEDLFHTTDGRSQPDKCGTRQDRRGRRPAAAHDRAHPVLPLRSGRGGQGHARLHPSAPVRKGRAGQHRAPRR